MRVVGRLGRKGANGGWLDCEMRQNWNGEMEGVGGMEEWRTRWGNGEMEGVGGKGLMAMNKADDRFVIGLYRL
ncbi:hypothetical protein [Bartonella sp. CL162QHHD]|uniref:hypothetical protein n=1 Tax=Bartonella sp. CL162QHHD TaxID=3243516 RepID=UPI0035CE9EAD